MLQTLDFLLYSKYFWITALLAGSYAYLKFFVYAHWRKRGVPHVTPMIPFGNILPIVTGKMHLGNFVKESYMKFRKHRFHGVYMLHQPVLMITDPELVHQILIKEFNKFQSRGTYSNEKVDPLMANLFNISGEKWKKLRVKLSPTFTSNKLKEMFPLIKEISDELITICDQTLVDADVIEIKDLMSRYTIDIISSIAFGFNCKSLGDPENEFKRYGDMAFNVSRIKNMIAPYAPATFDILRIPYFRKDMTRFFSKTFQDAVKHRRRNDVVRKDFLNLLIQLLDEGALDGNASGKNKITMSEAQAQAFIFFLGGFETSSSIMTYLLYELALNPKIQSEVHGEISEFSAKGEVTYGRIQSELKYLDTVVSETMRKYPTFAGLIRVCNADWPIPDSNLTIRRGDVIMIPLNGLHYDPEVYPDPEKFEPTRFSNDGRDSTRTSYLYLPFGDGPRYCIGARFAMLQMKLGLVALLSNYTFSKCRETVVPMKYSTRSFTQPPGCGIYLRMEKRVKDQ